MGTVLPREEIALITAKLHKDNKKIVFTNGVFDIIHRGHIEYLNSARSLGDVLVVGVNADISVQRIKGRNRPIVPEEDRAFVLSNLNSVDYVCLFSEDTPYETIRLIKPDILVKGADWKIENIVGRDIVEQRGGKVVTINYVSGKSTTNIIQRIIELNCQ
ncbi:MAG: D-glycero-beta-D-manno-heptose 1-phosphate adenylyltransferase [Candidatus Kryptoniota bacterium]